MPRYTMCPLCEACFNLAQYQGKFPRHRGIGSPICEASEKTEAEANGGGLDRDQGYDSDDRAD